MFHIRRPRRGILFFLVPLFIITLSACSGKPSSSVPAVPDEVLVPEHPGTEVLETDTAQVDISNIREGYFSACYLGSASKVKLQLTGPDAITYTYDMPLDKSWDTFPFTAGNGTYTLMLYELLEEGTDQYFCSLAQELDVELRDELLPFLYPNQFVNFDKDTEAVAVAKELTADCEAPIDEIRAIYQFATTEISYDTQKAATVTSGYLPDIDETLHTKTGICFDYAALMTCMLRSLGIPTKLQIGFSGEIKHAWISTYLEGSGWADNIIRFDGTGWAMMDPTFASEMGTKEAADYIGDGENYTLQYSR